jgi:hypothetical protein
MTRDASLLPLTPLKTSDNDTHGVVKREYSLQHAFFTFRTFMGASALSLQL